jgi:hypothetical protein
VLAAFLLFASAGGELRLSDFFVHRGTEAVAISPAKANATVVVFISSVCPIADKYLERLNDLHMVYAPAGVQFVMVNSNANETWRDMEAYASRNGATFPVYRDEGNHLADRLSAQSTPEGFVIDRSGLLRYRGRIDDATNPARVRSHSLRDAIASVLKNREVTVPRTRVLGCAIHRLKQR